MGATEFNCRCGQKPTNILLVGCTQHGKSSLIRALFDYAGLKHDGDNVKIGAYGNSSTTKDCTTFEIVVKKRDHFIRDDDGKVRMVNMDKFTPHEVSDLMDDAAEEFSRPTGKHVHLRIIDTPGLDDSDNAAAARKKGSQALRGATPLRVVDEKHKMAILKAVAEAGYISSVCFVISSQSPLNFSLQGLLKEYLEIFKLSRLNKAYHFLHTKVDAEALFETKTQSRAVLVSQKLGEHGASHHFMENLPDPNDPVAVYFAHRSMAKWLAEISVQTSQPVTELKYPKSDGHKAMDKTLRMVMDLDLEHYKDLARKATNELASLEAKQKRLSARRDVQEEAWSDLYNRIDRLNTTDLVEIESRYGSERSHFFRRSLVVWDIGTDYTIRKVTRDPASPSYSTWGSYDDSTWVGNKSYYNSLYSDSRDSSVSGTVKLFAWKSDVEANEISRLQTEKSDAWSEYQQTETELTETRTAITTATATKKSKEDQVSTCQTRIAKLNPTSIPLSAIQTNGAYYATCSLISYAFAVGLTQNKIHKFQFPSAWPADDTTATRITAKYAAKVHDAQTMRATCEAMAAGLDDEISALKTTADTLSVCGKRIAKGIADVQNRITEQLTPPSPTREGVSSAIARTAADRDATQRLVDYLRDEVGPLLDTGRRCAENTLGEYVEQLVARQVFVQAAAEKVAEAIGKYVLAKEKWMERELDVTASLEAARAMNDTLTTVGYLTVGPFGVLKEATDELGAGSEEAWDVLYYHVREAYLDDPARFEWVMRAIS